MNKEKLEEKLAILRAKEKAYNIVTGFLELRAKNEKLSPMLRDAFYSVFRMTLNCKHMISFAINLTEHKLKELS